MKRLDGVTRLRAGHRGGGSPGAPAVVWDKASKGAQAYVALTEEILKGTP